jgi:two-component system response regulator
MSKACKVLLVEDREDDAMLIRRAVAQSDSLILVHHAKNAKETVSYLQGAGVYTDRERYPFPDVLVLDLEMLNEDGFQVLDWLKGSPLARCVKAVALAAEEHPSYLVRASDLGARCCLSKPFQQAALGAFAAELEAWCHSAPPASSIT